MKIKKFMTAVAATAIWASSPATFMAHAQDQNTIDLPAETYQAPTFENPATNDAETSANLPAVSVQTLDPRMTVSNILGQPVYNTKQERVGTVSDIILDRNGKAVEIVVADAEIPGFDLKTVAFDYSSVVKQDEKGAVVMRISEAMIDQARALPIGSYSQESIGAPSQDRFSASELLDSDLVDPQNTPVANVDNISFEDGQAKEIIVAFDQVLGLGGKKAALEFQSAEIVQNGTDVNFQLSAARASQFNALKDKTE